MQTEARESAAPRTELLFWYRLTTTDWLNWWLTLRRLPAPWTATRGSEADHHHPGQPSSFFSDRLSYRRRSSLFFSPSPTHERPRRRLLPRSEERSWISFKWLKHDIFIERIIILSVQSADGDFDATTHYATSHKVTYFPEKCIKRIEIHKCLYKN